MGQNLTLALQYQFYNTDRVVCKLKGWHIFNSLDYILVAGFTLTPTAYLDQVDISAFV